MKMIETGLSDIDQPGMSNLVETVRGSDHLPSDYLSLGTAGQFTVCVQPDSDVLYIAYADVNDGGRLRIERLEFDDWQSVTIDRNLSAASVHQLSLTFCGDELLTITGYSGDDEPFVISLDVD
jgi:hypothetical protein